MCSPTAVIFQHAFTEVNGLIRTYIQEWNPALYKEQDGCADSTEASLSADNQTLEELDQENGPKQKYLGNVLEYAGLIQLVKANFTHRISALPIADQANLFDKAVARAILQTAADNEWSWTEGRRRDEALLELTYSILFNSGVPTQYGALSLETLIDEAATRLTNVSNEVRHLARELGELPTGEGDSRKIEESFFGREGVVTAHERVARLMALLYKRLNSSNSSSWRQTHGLIALRQFGYNMARQIMRLLKDLQTVISPIWTGSFIRVVILWLDVTGRFFVEELLKQPDQCELDAWRSVFSYYFRNMSDTRFPPPRTLWWFTGR